MRVLILSPTAPPTVTGNAMTAQRWRKHLVELGVKVQVLGTQGLSAEAFGEELNRFRPDVIHVHHLSKAGRVLLDRLNLEAGGLPLVASPGGTDLHLDLQQMEQRWLVLEVLMKARLIIVQEPEMGREILTAFPGAESKLVLIPKSPYFLGTDPYDLRGAVGAERGDIVFFLPAGIRVVKGILEWLSAMEEVYRQRALTKVALAGPILDEDYAGAVINQVRRLERFVRFLGTIPPSCMFKAYGGADVVVNSSVSEGLSNSLLEASSQGVPILASDVPGNRYLVLGGDGFGPCGLLYRREDPSDLVSKALRLIDDQALRARLSSNGKARAAKEFDPRKEARLLLEAYRKALHQ